MMASNFRFIDSNVGDMESGSVAESVEISIVLHLHFTGSNLKWILETSGDPKDHQQFRNGCALYGAHFLNEWTIISHWRAGCYAESYICPVNEKKEENKKLQNEIEGRCHRSRDLRGCDVADGRRRNRSAYVWVSFAWMSRRWCRITLRHFQVQTEHT